MPKLFQINIALNMGSTGRIAEQIGNLAKEQGWEVWIAHGPRYVNPSSHNSYQVCTSWEKKFHVAKSRLNDGYGLGCTAATKRLVEKIKDVKPDIIHLHNIHGYYLDIRVLFDYLKDAGIPVVWTLHDCWAMTGHCPHFEHIGCDRWKTLCHNCPQKTIYPECYLFDRSKRNHRIKKQYFSAIDNLTLVPVSDWLKRIVEQSFFSLNKSIKIQTICNGVDLEVFNKKSTEVERIREKYGLKDKFIGLALATQWSELKGWYDYLQLSDRLPDNMKIVLVGLNDSQKRQLPDNVIGIDVLNDVDELAALYSAADVVLNLSYLESFGLTTVEGFACGTPAIVYNCTASPELIKEGTGYVVEKGDIESVVRCMDEIREKGKCFYSDRCRKVAEIHYDKNVQYKKYMELYNSLLEV